MAVARRSVIGSAAGAGGEWEDAEIQQDIWREGMWKVRASASRCPPAPLGNGMPNAYYGFASGALNVGETCILRMAASC